MFSTQFDQVLKPTLECVFPPTYQLSETFFSSFQLHVKVQFLNAPESKIAAQIPKMNHQMLDREAGNFVSQETKPNLSESSL